MMSQILRGYGVGFRIRPLAYLCIMLLTFGFQPFSDPVNALMVGNVTQCVKKGDAEPNPFTCEKRSHINIDVYGGLKGYDYVLRHKDNPNKGLYIHVYTADTMIIYPLTYISDVPLMYKEHNISKTYSEMNGQCSKCEKITHAKCTTIDNLPPYLRSQFKEKICCSCNVNVSDSSPRAEFSCRGITSALMIGTCANMACLEVVEPWYSLFKPKYPPDILRRIFVDVFEFDGDNDIIPDVAKKGYVDANASEEDRLFLKKPVFKDGHFKATLSQNVTFAKCDELDVSFKIIKSSFVDGNAPKKLEEYVAIPSWPDTNPTVQGCSRKFDCIDPTWKEQQTATSVEADPRLNRMERCAYNIRAVEGHAIDTTGVSCDKIGVSLGTWGNEGRLCNSPKGSCIQNQLGWYLEEKGEAAKLPRMYDAPPLIMRKGGSKTEKSEAVNEWQDRNIVQAISYTIKEADVSRIEINSFYGNVTEIISNSFGFIVRAIIEGDCVLASNESCLVIVTTKNTGKDPAPYAHRVHCYEGEINERVVAATKEYSVDIEGNETSTIKMPLLIMDIEVSKPLLCEVQLYSGGKDLIDSITVPLNLAAPKATMGPDTRSQDSVTNPAAKIGDDDTGPIDYDGQCHCTGFAVLCFFSNFSPCMRHFFDSYYKWFVIVIAVVVTLLLLPIVIPLLRCLFGRIIASIRSMRSRRDAEVILSTRSNIPDLYRV